MIKAKKRYGQNFLRNKEVLNNISSLINVNTDDLIIEIGPGMGALTDFLVRKNSNFLAYEIDERMKYYLDTFQRNNVKIIYDDFLKRNIVSDLKEFSYKNLFVVANIPYYITSPILVKLLESELKFKEIILLVQKEFAERLAAKWGSKEYNALTLFVDYYYNVEIKFDVDRCNFIPIPNVDSAVIDLKVKDGEKELNKDFYFQFIKEAFKNKRKTLKNNLNNYEWERILSILKELGYNERVRAEEISPDNFKKIVKLYNS